MAASSGEAGWRGSAKRRAAGNFQIWESGILETSKTRGKWVWVYLPLCISLGANPQSKKGTKGEEKIEARYLENWLMTMRVREIAPVLSGSQVQ